MGLVGPKTAMVLHQSYMTQPHSWLTLISCFAVVSSFTFHWKWVNFCAMVLCLTFRYVNSSVRMKNAPLLAYYQSYLFNLTSIINHQWCKSFTSAK